MACRGQTYSRQYTEMECTWKAYYAEADWPEFRYQNTKTALEVEVIADVFK